MNKKRIYVAQFGTDSNINLLPLSAGYLISRLKKEKELLEELGCEIGEILFKREEPKELVSKIKNPVVVGFSCYLWNMNHSLEVAKELKNRFPNTLVVFGGHSIPQDFEEGKEFLKKHTFIDVLGVGEGEELFALLCINYLKEENFDNISGIIYRDKSNIIYNPEKVLSLETLPSPYLDGTFDELYRKYKEKFSGVIMEVTRGCPYKCSYCSWGNQSMSLRTKPLNILKKEVEWIGKNKINYITMADANVGISEIDLEFVRLLANCKKKYGFPNYFSVSWIKNSSDKVLEIAKILKEHGIGFRITLSLQSLNEDVLKAINRINIKKEHFDRIKKEYRKDNAYSYTELILGLPLETYESFMSGVENSLSTSIFDQIWIYPLFLLSNTELWKSSSRKKYGIETKKIELVYTKNKTNYKIKEFVEIVIGTSTMPKEKWIDAFVNSQYILALHDDRLAFFILNYLKKEFGVRITELVEFSRKKSFYYDLPVIRNSFLKLENCALNVQNKRESHLIIPRGYGGIPFDAPEGIFLELLLDKEKFCNEFLKIVESYLEFKDISFNKSMLRDLFKFQEAIIASPNEIGKQDGEMKYLELDYNWINYFRYAFQLEEENNDNMELKPVKMKLKIVDPSPCPGDTKKFLENHFDIRGKPAFNLLYDNQENLIFPPIKMPGFQVKNNEEIK